MSMIEDDRTSDLVVGLRLVFQLTPQETNLMLLLMTMRFVSPELIYERLNVATEVRVAMYRLRKSLLKHDIPIESKRSFGYWLTDESKVKVRAIIAESEAT